MSDSDRDDESLVLAVARGDEDAFSVLYRRHLPTVLAFLRRRLDDPDLVFDLAAETFAAVVVSAARFRRGGAPAVAWLLGIARNKLLQSLRKRRVEDEARRRLAMAPIEVLEEDHVSIGHGAEEGAAALDRALAGLTPETRAALTARIVEEREYRDIARELGCSELVVRQRVHRGLTRLRTRLEGDR